MKYHQLFRYSEDLIVVGEIIFYNWEGAAKLLALYVLGYILGSTLQGISSFENRFSKKLQLSLYYISYFIKGVSVWISTSTNQSISLNVQLIIQFYFTKQNHIYEKEVPCLALFLICLNTFNYKTITADNYFIFAFDLVLVVLDVKHLSLVYKQGNNSAQYSQHSFENTTTHQKCQHTFQFDLPTVKSVKQPIFSGDRFQIKKIVFNSKQEVFSSSINLEDYIKQDLNNIDNNISAIEMFQELSLLYIFNEVTHRIKISEFISQHFDELSNVYYFSIEDNDIFDFKDTVLLIEQEKNSESEVLITISFLDVPQKFQRKQGKVKKKLFFDICRSLSHELGSSLNAILTLSNLAAQNEGISEQIKTQYLYPILINSIQLNLILNNVRDFTQIGLSQFQIKLEEMPIIQTIEFINSLFEKALESKNIELSVRFNLRNQILITDKERFEQIYFQLLQNAVKFTLSGQIRVIVHNNADRFIISIEDTGIGLNEQEEINLNYMLDNNEFVSVSKNSVGSSMGLAISNMIVKQMNRNIPIKFQRLLIGTQFYFELPNVLKDPVYIEKKNNLLYQQCHQTVKMITSNSYVEGPLGQQPHMFFIYFGQSQQNRVQKRKDTKSLSIACHLEEDIESEEQLDGSQIKISDLPAFVTKQRSDMMEYSLYSDCCARVLIVDDDYFNIQCLKLIMIKYGVKCDHAYNGQEAIDLVEKKQCSPCSTCNNVSYLLFFLDINMPVMDGYQTIIELKKLVKAHNLKNAFCIANSGFCDLQTKITCYKLGMDYFMAKPLNHGILKEILLSFFPTLSKTIAT